MSLKELLESIKRGKNNFTNEVFTFNISFEQRDFDTNIKFYNCIEQNLKVKDINRKTLSFSSCTFQNSVIFTNCDLYELSMTGIKSIKELKISDSRFNTIKLNSSDFINGDFFLINSYVRVELDCSGMMINSGKFFVDSKYNNEKPTVRTDFRNSFFHEFFLSANLDVLLFENSRIEKLLFENVNVNTSYFTNSEFGREALFQNSEFNFNVSFSNIKSKAGKFGIQICKIKGNSYFNNAVFDKLFISDTVFESRSSFNHVEVNHFELYLVNFLKPVYFDELKIGIIKDCNRPTLRTIKQELQKTDNKIDYNRFRAYELQAYYKELKWNGNFRDKFILGATWLATGFDYSWRRALAFTLGFALLFYTLFFISENYFYSFDLSYWKEFASGYFRFLLITDFYNPLIKEREFLTEPLSWFIFILGKIFIAFGIYEMIQAFRKFKA